MNSTHTAQATAADVTPRIQAGTRAIRRARELRDECRHKAREHLSSAVRLTDEQADSERRIALAYLREASRWDAIARGEIEEMEDVCD